MLALHLRLKHPDVDMSTRSHGVSVMKFAIILAALFLAKTKSNMFFYSLAEIAGVAIFLSIFLLIWNSRKYLKNSFFIFIGIAYFFVGVFGAIYVLVNAGFDIFPGYGQDLSEQLETAMRFILGLSFALAPLFVRKKVNAEIIFFAYSVASAVILLSIFQWNIFPEVYGPDGEQSQFKSAMSHATLAAMLWGLFFLHFRKEYFNNTVFFFLEMSLFFNILVELVTIGNWSLSGITSVISHILMISAAYFSYLGIVEAGMMDPFCLFLRELRTKEKKLKESEERAKLLIDLAPHAMIIHEKGKIIFANPAAADLCGSADFPSNPGKSIYDFIRNDYHSFMAKRFQSLACGILVAPSSEIKFMKGGGKCVDVEETSVLIKNDERELIYTIFKDISKRKAAQEKIQHMSTYDMLTGLYNAHYFEKQLLKFKGRREFNGGIIMVDIKGLRKINNTHGHFVGDEIIQLTASNIANEFRDEDIVSRIGGDEFCILLPNTDMKMVSVIAERIKEKIDGIKLDGSIEVPGISVGIAYARNGTDVDEAFEMAKKAMIRNKKTDEKNIHETKTNITIAVRT